ncbi:hypothetical protein FQN60_004929 [Etheostoma spectabile]|uniref:Uncharacterized protein n=1 Tax=Etheostoma spectabile TaxID=54343 RepID=A0A5J5DL02_9PERO|nr:hypothetical protein FQN60_004929 [Etheostoma spectabile]
MAMCVEIWILLLALHVQVRRDPERASQSAGSPVKGMTSSAGCVLFATTPLVLSQLIQLLLCRGWVGTNVLGSRPYGSPTSPFPGPSKIAAGLLSSPEMRILQIPVITLEEATGEERLKSRLLNASCFL